jgi:ferredoxin
LVYPLLRRRPVLIPERCTRCERCGQSCPVGAIAMKPLPRIDPGTCIACYCCSETCPERAYRIPGQAETILRNLFRR